MAKTTVTRRSIPDTTAAVGWAGGHCVTVDRTAGQAGGQGLGFNGGQLVGLAARADVHINISGVLRDETVLAAARRRLYLDVDPAFPQLWHEADGIDMGFARHTDFVTIGLAIGSPDCSVPSCDASTAVASTPVAALRRRSSSSSGCGSAGARPER